MERTRKCPGHPSYSYVRNMPVMMTDPSGMVANCNTVRNSTDDQSTSSDSDDPGMLPNEEMDPPAPQAGCPGVHTPPGGGGDYFDGGYVGDDSGLAPVFDVGQSPGAAGPGTVPVYGYGFFPQYGVDNEYLGPEWGFGLLGYDVLSANQLGGDPGGGGADQLQAIIKQALKQAKLGECLKKFFGPNVTLTLNNAPNIDASKAAAQLGGNAGLTDPALVPDAGKATVFVASETITNEFATGPTATPGFAQAVYLHEVGNALAMQTFTNMPNKGNRALLGPMGGPPTPDQQAQANLKGGDKDIGRQFENCIFGGSASGNNQKP